MCRSSLVALSAHFYAFVPIWWTSNRSFLWDLYPKYNMFARTYSDQKTFVLDTLFVYNIWNEIEYDLSLFYIQILRWRWSIDTMGVNYYPPHIMVCFDTNMSLHCMLWWQRDPHIHNESLIINQYLNSQLNRLLFPLIQH